jgi:hypothetical protein
MDKVRGGLVSVPPVCEHPARRRESGDPRQRNADPVAEGKRVNAQEAERKRFMQRLPVRRRLHGRERLAPVHEVETLRKC